MNEREKAAQRISDEGWCPKGPYIEADDDGYTVSYSMFVSHDSVNAYLKENNLCDLADRRDAEDEERRMEG